MRKASKLLTCTAALSALMLSPLAFSYEAGDIVFRAGITTVDPDDSSDNVAINGQTLSLSGGTSELSVEDDTQLGLTLEYFFSKNLGLELLASTPFTHDANGEGELSGISVAEAKQLPPTLSLVYHFDGLGAFEPYVGAGINYTIFFDEDIDSEAATALEAIAGLTGGDVELDDSVGLALQVGFDYHINDKWLVNASVRYINIETEAEITFDDGTVISSDIDIDPYVWTISAGYKF
ncbi:OmpW/AlkL family protein [Sessilibacter sp. MAH2]